MITDPTADYKHYSFNSVPSTSKQTSTTSSTSSSSTSSDSTDLTSTSGAIHFTGLGNGTDFDSMINSLLAVEGMRKTTLENWKASWNNKIEYFQALNVQMLRLKTSLEGMDTVGEFLTKEANVTDSSVLTATADADADEGSHTIEVNQTAQTSVMVSQASFASEDTSVNGTGGDLVFAYSYGSDPTVYSLTVPNGSSLKDLKDIINADSDNPGVKASVLYDGTSYYLQIRSMDTGADEGEITIDGTTTVTDFDDNSKFDETQVNQDAQFRVDGWPAAGWIERSTNTISDVIAGLTLNLRSDSGGSTETITVGTDYEAVKENVRTFVDQVNQVRNLIKLMTKFDETTQRGSLLTGNYGVQLISSQLKTTVSDKAPGFDYDDDTYCTLSQLGILTDAEEGSVNAGLLVLDEEELDEALDADPYAVALLFSAVDVGSTNSSDISYESCISGTTEAGVYTFEYTVDASGDITSASVDGVAVNPDFIGNTKHTIMSDSGGSRGIVISVNNLNAGTYSHQVNFKQGKTGELIDKLEVLTADEVGPLAILEENYDDIVDNIDKKIDYEDRRIKTMETRLRERYANLDARLGYYDDILSQLKSQIAQLDN
ncbi:flagellar filament capping protein FliD [Desulfovibrio inopinatus]|uniref:flagellar filament capping protein FliD n=1 Tax=Desulfovibrio inopinatus TaxID=102109 RepID=UPI00042447FB|nr:flagellar filament capping protein FliD [Desulfovibrio inopinatus]